MNIHSKHHIGDTIYYITPTENDTEEHLLNHATFTIKGMYVKYLKYDSEGLWYGNCYCQEIFYKNAYTYKQALHKLKQLNEALNGKKEKETRNSR